MKSVLECFPRDDTICLVWSLLSLLMLHICLVWLFMWWHTIRLPYIGCEICKLLNEQMSGG